MIAEYILYCSQDKNYQTRSFMISNKNLDKKLNHYFEILRSNSEKNKNIKHNNLDIVVDNLITQNVQNHFKSKIYDNPLYNSVENYIESSLCNDAILYLNNLAIMNKPPYKIINNIASGYDHINNYKSLYNKNIIEGFLILQKIN